MIENQNDQKVQGHQDDQKNQGSHSTPNHGHTGGLNTPNTQNRDDWKENENPLSSNDENPNAMREETETKKNEGIQNPSDYQDSKHLKEEPTSINDLKEKEDEDEDDKEEDNQEFDDLKHPHKVDTPTASGIDDGKSDLEVEDSDRRGITNQGDEKIN